MKTDSLLTSSSKLSYQQLNSILNKSMTVSLSNVSSFSTRQMTLKKTCSCSTCTCSNNSMTYQNMIQSHSFENNDDCLAYAFIILYESSIWCMQIIYELFFKSLWQILMYVKQELQYGSRYKQTSNSSMDMMSIDRSTPENHLLVSKNKNYSDLSRYHLPLFEVRNQRKYCQLRRSNCEDKILFWNETHHLPSNQNMNQASTEHKDSCSRDKHIVVVPIRSSHCQTETSKSDLQTINIDLKQSEKTINLHEPLNDILCRRLHKPLMFINRDVFCRHNRTLFYSTVPSGQNFSQQQLHEEKKLSSFQQSSLSESSKQIASTLSSADRNKELSTINAANLFSAKNKFSLSNTKNESTFLHDLTDIQSDKTLFLNNSQPFVINLHQGKQSNKKFKRNRRIINDHSIPLALATSLHSNLRLYDEDYFLTKYIHPLFTEKHYVR